MLIGEVERYAREIVPSFNAYAYFRIGYALARRTVRLLYRVRLGYADGRGAGRYRSRTASVVFVMNHRSNIDYIIVAYMAANRSALSYAVGEWARVWPLQALVRSLGAYFVRRDSGNPLYRHVLARYVQAATASGVVQAVYPRRAASAATAGCARRASASSTTWSRPSIPPAIATSSSSRSASTTTRVLEDRSLVRTLDPDAEPRSGALRRPATVARFVLRSVVLMLRRRCSALATRA